MEVHVRVERVTEAPVTVTAEAAGVTAGQRVGGRAAVLALRVPDPEPWWPRGYGEQPLYDLTVRLGEQEWRGRVGFRSVELDREAFRLRVHGVPVFVKGVNWIPDDCFAPRITGDRLAERFGQATAGGTIHIWDVWNRADYTRYAAYRPRFVAEFGFQGPPAYATLRRASSDEPLTPDSSHQKAVDGQGKLLRGLGEHLPAPETFDDWHYLTQLNQARAVAFGIERFRALMPYCMGTIVWQLNDCWPVTSWPAVDGDGRLKPLWYALRRAYADRLLSVQDGALAVVNDTGEPWSGQLRLVRRSLAGEPLAREVVPVRAAPRSVLRVALPGSVATPGDPARELLTAALDTVRTVGCYAEDTAVAFPEAAYDARAERVPGAPGDRHRRKRAARADALPRQARPRSGRGRPARHAPAGGERGLPRHHGRELDTGALTRFPVLRCVNEPAPGGMPQCSLPARSQVM
ncbi:hypothetical protein [Nonomuraea deserti]|uniref:hypothetical protein n=1 Tax=Nonomuraea deserti TaxID=1848322 RepID=UPI003F6E24A7